MLRENGQAAEDDTADITQGVRREPVVKASDLRQGGALSVKVEKLKGTCCSPYELLAQVSDVKFLGLGAERCWLRTWRKN